MPSLISLVSVLFNYPILGDDSVHASHADIHHRSVARRTHGTGQVR